jgi:hypothetical protein
VVIDDVSDYPGTQIYSGTDAWCVRINQSGSRVAFNRDGTICMIDVNGGPVTELVTARADSWVDFPEDEWVYYTSGGRWHRVSTSGDKIVEKDILSCPNGSSYSIARGGKRGGCISYNACGNVGATAYGNVSFCRQGCGAGISVSGRYLTHNQQGHNELKIYDLNAGGKQAYRFDVEKFGAAAEYWNLNGFSANSDEWLCFKQGEHYLQKSGARQVVYKVDGSHGIEIQPFTADVFYEGGDFWLGDPSTTSSRVKRGRASQNGQNASLTPDVNITSDRKGIVCHGTGICALTVYRLDGRAIVRRNAEGLGTQGHIFPGHGIYIVHLSTKHGIRSQRMTVGLGR